MPAPQFNPTLSGSAPNQLASWEGYQSELQRVLGLTWDAKADLDNSGKIFPDRASAVAAAQENLPAAIRRILTEEGNFLVLRAPFAQDPDPLFSTSPYWGEVTRFPNVLLLDGKADAASATPSYTSRAAAVAAAADLPTSVVQILVREGTALVIRSRTAFVDDPLFETGARWGVVQRQDVDAESTARAVAVADANLRTASRVPLAGPWADAAQAAGQWQFANTAYQAGQVYNASFAALQANAQYRAMLVPVAQGDVMRFSGAVNGASTALAVWVNAAGAIVGSLVRPGTTSEVIHTDVVAIAPVGAVGVWMTGQLFASRFPMAERLVSGVSQARAPARLAVDADLSLSDWQFVLMSWVTGGYIDRQTGGTTSSGAHRHARISVTPGETLRLTGDVAGTGLPLWVWYNASGGMIYSHGRGEIAAVQIRGLVVTAPAGAAQIGVTQLTAAAQPFVIERQTQIASVPAFVAKRIADELISWEQVALAPLAGSYYRASDGVVVANAGYSRAAINVQADEKVRLSGNIFGSAIALAVWLGAGGSYLGSYGLGANAAPAQFRDVELTAPPGAVQLGMSWRNTEAAAARADKTVTAPSIAAYVNERLTEFEAAGYWAGKSIAWFGTSIPAGSIAGGRYPQQIGERLGAEVYNMAVSGSVVRAGVRSAVTAEDPYGFASTSWGTAVFGLSHTLAEKQDIIANWSTYRSLFRASSNPPLTLTTAQQNAILASSFETRLVADNLGANRRDAYVFDIGFNDAGMADDLTSGSPGTRDRMTYRGAMNYLIDLILRDNPRASILFVGHFDAEDPSRTTLIDAQQAVADYWSRPLWQGWEVLGWSSAIEVQTNGYWMEYLWVPTGGPLQTLSMNEVWTPDGVHPAYDESGTAVRRIVDAMLPWWQSQAR